jgi:isoleucyl-tRNA synthetase
VFNFATTDLSAFYFDIRKDVLYCDRAELLAPARGAHGASTRCSRGSSPGSRRSCFTMEEAWTTRLRRDESVHLQLFPRRREDWANEALLAKWERCARACAAS